MSDESYFQWLYRRVGALSEIDPSHSHSILTSMLHSYDFVPMIQMDENRVYDALSLRLEYADETGDRSVLRQDDTCSVLEMIMALTERIDFETRETSIGYEFGEWFWVLLDNLGLRNTTDDVFMDDMSVQTRRVGRIIGSLNSRSYLPSGKGGLFPLHKPEYDQRSVEIWSQMQSYLLENGDFG